MPYPSGHLRPTGNPNPGDPDWNAWSTAWTKQVKILTGRTDLTVTVAPGAGGGAPACFFPAERRIEVVEGEANDRIVLDDVSIAYPDGSVVVHAASAELLQGERTLIVAGSGTGKSTLVRAIAGIWPWGAGRRSPPPP